ncbi:MAG: DUF1801 domain-containing protein [Chloroflexi bacterium]|nr:DUF1801 domain-containing protein [Chloroflexota bacterium]
MLDQLRDLVRGAAPEATEAISYDMLAFKVRGKRLVYLAGWQNHCAVYGLEGGTIKLPLTEPIPTARLTELLQLRLAALAGVRR